MRRPRVRISQVMALVAFAALDLAAARAVMGVDPGFADLIGVGSLPMANVLGAATLLAARRPGARPFALGFVAFGLGAMAAYGALAWRSPETTSDGINAILDPLVSRILVSPQPVWWQLAAIYALAAVLLALPQLALASVGGLLSRRYRVAIVRRDLSGSIAPHPPEPE